MSTPNSGVHSYRIAVDAMGGDHAPDAVIQGLKMAVEETDVKIILVGSEPIIRNCIEKNGGIHPAPEIVNASEIVTMSDNPTSALRKKKDSSIHVGLRLVKENKASAFLSAGNTGAVMAIATLVLRTLDGIDRPTITINLPTSKGNSILLDAGANVDCKATHLFQFGIMGSVYAKTLFSKPNPTVGLLSIGEEDSKGNEITREAFRMLKDTSLNFIGNIEAKEVYRGNADVIICDGFIGNIALKISESMVELVQTYLKELYSKNMRTKLSYKLIQPYLTEFMKTVDYTEYGGAPLLGLNGTTMIAHGSSSPKAFKNAILRTHRFLQENLTEQIRKGVQEYGLMAETKSDKKGLWKQIKNSIRLDSERDKN